jgi:sensor domain CHASE-containing protein
MTLVQKAALTVTLFAVANLGFAFSIKHNWIDPAFEGFEQRLAEKSMLQATEAIEYTVAQLDNRAHDYASWDSTYEYALSGDPDYYEENLSRGVLTDLGIDWLAIVDKFGRVVSGPIRNVDTYEVIAIPEIPNEQWELTHPLLLGDTRKESVSGMMVTDAGPMMGIDSDEIFGSASRVSIWMRPRSIEIPLS